MNKQTIPNTSIGVSAISLGTAEFGTTINQASAFQLMDLYAEAGGNLLDTANMYAAWVPGGKGKSEQTIGAWMKARKNRERIVISTKGAHPELNASRASRMSHAEITRDLEQSLHDLDTDYADVYFLHRDDPRVSVEEILAILESKIQEGKIRYYACSNWQVERIREASKVAQAKGYHGFVANQLMWSLADVDENPFDDPTLVSMGDADYRFHQETGMAVMAYTSQAKGFFSKLDREGEAGLSPQLRRAYGTKSNVNRLPILRRLSQEWQVSINAIVVAYLYFQTDFFTIPIVGSRTIEQLQDSLDGLKTNLSASQLRQLKHGV